MRKKQEEIGSVERQPLSDYLRAELAKISMNNQQCFNQSKLQSSSGLLGHKHALIGSEKTNVGSLNLVSPIPVQKSILKNSQK